MREYDHHMRIVVILIIIGIVGCLLFQGIRFFVLTRKSSELVKMSARYERRLTEGKPRILVIGDSTGVGTGVDDPTESIAGMFGTEFPSAYIQNESVNGWKVADAVRNFPNVPHQDFDIVLLQIGANDILRATPMTEFTVTLEELFRKSTAAGKKVYALHSGNIGLAPLFPWPVSRIMRSRTLRYRAEYTRIAAQNGVTYVDLYHEAEDDPFREKPEAYAADELHLTGAGYAEWYRTIREVMKEI